MRKARLKYITISILCAIILCITAFMLFGRGSKELLDPQNPVTLTLWHPYSQQMEKCMDDLVKEFNDTVGSEKGIIIETTLTAEAAELNEKLMAAVNKEVIALDFPDLAVIYPRMGITLAENDLLVDYTTLFTDSELKQYVPEFIEEGRLGGDKLYVFPIAKSTEVLYVNKTIFDRFSKDTGVPISQLATMEGILNAADKYYDWISEKKPGIAKDAKAFFYPVDLMNTAMIGCRQLGEDFIKDRRLNITTPGFKRIWDAYYPPAVKGRVPIFDGIGNSLFATGEIVCAAGTTAGITFYPDSVTYADNTKEKAEYAILPYPVFKGGKKVAMQRGSGICLFKSDEKKEYAASVFIKWFTQPEQNLRFTINTGYIPVTEAAFGEPMEREIEKTENVNMKKIYETISKMQKEYSFYYPPVFDGFEDMQINYAKNIRNAAKNARMKYRSKINNQTPDEVYKAVFENAFEKFISTQK